MCRAWSRVYRLGGVAAAVVHLYLASSYDNLHQPTRRGEADNDRRLDLAIQHYRTAVDHETDQVRRTRAIRYLTAAYRRLARLDSTAGDLESGAAALREVTVLNPDNPEGFYALGVLYWWKVFRDADLSDEQEDDYIQIGLTELDKTLTLKADHISALVYKNIVLRMLANLSENRARRDELVPEADALRSRAEALLQRRRSCGG